MRHEPKLDLHPYFQTLDELESPIDWGRFFGNQNPVELDIGCGRGMFLVRASLANPHINYVGIEIDYKEGRRAARRLWKRSLPNARVIGGDARDFLRKYVPPHSVSAAHVYFPDPWWKRKHKKRRLFNHTFADLLAWVLKEGGEVHAWTDVEDYFQVIQALMDHHRCFTPLPPPLEHQPQHDMDYMTSFERKKRKEGKTIFRGRWRRGPIDPSHDAPPQLIL